MTNDILRLQDRREQIIKDLAVKEAMLAQKEAESSQLKKDIADANAACSAYRSQAEAQSREKEQIVARIAKLESDIATFQDLDAALRKELAGVFGLAFGKKKELKSKIEANESSLIAAKHELADLMLKKVSLEGSRDLVALDSEEKHIAQLQAKLEGTIRDIDVLIGGISEFRDSLAEVEKEISALEKHQRVLEQEAEEARRVADEQARQKVAEEAARIAAEEQARKEAEAARLAAEEQARQEAARKAAEEQARQEATRKAAEEQARKEAARKAAAEEKAKREAARKASLQSQSTPSTTPKTQKTVKHVRPRIADPRLAASVDRVIDKLEAYFPEYKVFALDSIDSSLRERISELYKQAGYATVDDMLHAYGFEIISGDAVRELRSFVMYTPGNEPEAIRSKIQSMLSRLSEYYPDKVIPRGLQNDHKKLSQSVSGLYQWLGYPDAGSMLEAYGYQYQLNSDIGGRPSNDYDAVINFLVEKYKTAPKPRSMGDLIFDNPELKGQIKTLQNKSAELFGMTLKKYFDSLGIFASHGPSSARSQQAVSASKQEAVEAALAAVYENLNEDECGTLEDALACLENMLVKTNRAGQVYIFRATNCVGKVTIPYGIDFISDEAFMGQADLEELDIRANLTEIPENAFAQCSSLSKISLPEGIISIAAKAFSDCTSLPKVILPESLQQIGSKAFSGCTALQEVVFGNTRTMVSDDAFAGSSYEYEPAEESGSTDSKYFEYTTDRKGNATITGFRDEIESVVIPGMLDGHPVVAISKGAFQNCKHLVEVSMSDYITAMQGDAFRDCISLKKIHLSNGISKIITTSFTGCIGLKEINIPDAVTEIKKGTFKDSPLEKLHIGKSLSILDLGAFTSGERDPYTGRIKSTRAVNKITVDPANPSMKAVGAALLSKDGKKLLALLGSARSFAIPEGVESIGTAAFRGLYFLSDVSFPDSVVTIGEKAFAQTALRSVVFGAGLKKIKDGAFEGCDKLTAAVFNDGIEEIGDRAFEGSPIISVLLPASLRTLGSYAFNCLSGYYGGGEAKQEFKIDSHNPYIRADGSALYILNGSEKTLKSLYGQKYRQYVYDNRQKSPEYVVAEGTTRIAQSAFCRCTSLSKVTLPDGLLVIEDEAFLDCQSLKEINIPSSVEVIGNHAFKGTAIKEFKLGAALREVGLGAFITGDEWSDKRTKLRSIKVDKANETFHVTQKTLLKKKTDGTSSVLVYFGGDEVVALPDGVSEICSGAFMRSIAQEVQIPASVKAIGDKAFYGCSKLVRLRVGFAEPENGISFAVIYIPETKGGMESSVRDQYMDCIRIDGSGTLFDFVKYDSLFETIAETKDKILVATDRLKSSIQLVPLYRDKYLTYLRRHAQKAVQIVVEFDDLAGLNTLAELNVFTGKNIDQIIELANKAQKPEILSYLMNYKNTNFGVTEEDYDL